MAPKSAGVGAGVGAGESLVLKSITGTTMTSARAMMPAACFISRKANECLSTLRLITRLQHSLRFIREVDGDAEVSGVSCNAGVSLALSQGSCLKVLHGLELDQHALVDDHVPAHADMAEWVAAVDDGHGNLGGDMQASGDQLDGQCLAIDFFAPAPAELGVDLAGKRDHASADALGSTVGGHAE